MKGYRGRPPNPEAGWREAGAVTADGLIWKVYRRGEAEAAWFNLKVAATELAARKGNYWLAYSLREARFAQNRDASMLLAHRPSLATELMRWCHANHREGADV